MVTLLILLSPTTITSIVRVQEELLAVGKGPKGTQHIPSDSFITSPPQKLN